MEGVRGRDPSVVRLGAPPPPPGECGALHAAAYALVCGALGIMAKVGMTRLQRVSVRDDDDVLAPLALHGAAARRGRGLVTASNHASVLDDPCILSYWFSWRNLFVAQERLRWTFCATHHCFRTPLQSAFFSHGKVLPIERGMASGSGLYQPSMELGIAKLRRGEWLHIFPQGTRTPSHELGSSLRSGIGRLVVEGRNAAGELPFVVPIWAVGMDEIMPRGAALPSLGVRVTIKVGKPIEFDDLERAHGTSGAALQAAVIGRIRERLDRLRVEALREHAGGGG